MVNMLTYQALSTGKITAHCGELGGDLMRPNVHIEDITDLYVFMLEKPWLQGIYNAGFEKTRIKELAEIFPRLRRALLAINGRIVDLLPVARRR